MLYYNMKTKKRLTISFICCLLVSCTVQKTEEKPKLFAFQLATSSHNLTYKERLTSLSYSDFTLLYEQNWPLVIYFYQKGCKFVSELEPVLNKYLERTNLFVFAVDTKSQDFENLLLTYGETLNFKGTPSFYFWQKGVIYETVVGIRQINTETLLTETFARYVNLYNTRIAHEEKNAQTETSDLIVTLSFTVRKEITFLSKGLLPLLKTQDNILIVKKDTSTMTFSFTKTQVTALYDEKRENELLTMIKNYLS